MSFLLDYFFFQVPDVIYVVKHSVHKMIFCSLVFRGLYAAATGFVSNILTPMTIHLILGIVEAAVMPAMPIYINNWFTKAECSRVSTFLILGNPVTALWMSTISGCLTEAWGRREMPVIEGILMAIWALCRMILVRDKPADTGQPSEQEKQALRQVMDREQRDIKPMRSYDGVMCSRDVIMPCAVHALWSTGVHDFMMWMPSTLKNAAQMDIVVIGWLVAVPYLAAICLVLTVSWLSGRFQSHKPFIWSPLLIAAIAPLASRLLGNQSFWLSHALLVVAAVCMYTPCGPFSAPISELLSRSVSGVSVGMINSFGALGAFLGVWLVGYLNGVTGGPGVSYTFTAITLLASVMPMYCARARNETTSPLAETTTRQG